MPEAIGKTILSPSSPGSPCAYELQGNVLTARLFGLVPVFSIHLSNVHYLRLATRSEITPGNLLFNWSLLLPQRRSIRPIYVLKAKTGRRLLLKLEGDAHFRLRQAIGRQQSPEPRQRLAA